MNWLPQFAVLILTFISVKLSSAGHNGQQTRILDLEISDTPHTEGEHSEQYDHEAFLGKDMAHIYDKMSPAQAKDILGSIFDKIDTDKDGKASHKEMEYWIKKVERRSSVHRTITAWKEQFPKQKNKVYMTFREFEQLTYGRKRSKKEPMYKTDMRRWKMADADGDGNLDIHEMTDYNNPQESVKLSNLIAMETLEELDLNGDGHISEEEYLKDFGLSISKGGTEKNPDSEMLKAEKLHFSKERDLNGDGKLDSKEIKAWILPGDQTVKHEVDHLLKDADEDKDGSFTKEEMLAKQNLFIGSSATAYGDAILRRDEF